MSKYRAQKTECAQSHTHDSKLEARRCDELTVLESAGQIQRLEHQPAFPVIINGKTVCTYVADFAWFAADCRIIEDVKGMATPIFNLKRKLVEAAHPGTVITIWPPRKRKARKTKAAPPKDGRAAEHREMAAKQPVINGGKLRKIPVGLPSTYAGEEA